MWKLSRSMLRNNKKKSSTMSLCQHIYTIYQCNYEYSGWYFMSSYATSDVTGIHIKFNKAGLYLIWCGVNRLGDRDLHTLSDTSAFVNPAGQLLLTRRGIQTRMDGVGIVFEFYIASLIRCWRSLGRRNADGLDMWRERREL